MSTIEIGKRKIGAGEPTWVVAEMASNHGQDFGQAVRILQAAKVAGADAVKLQTFTPDGLTLDSPREEFALGDESLWPGRSLYDLYREAQTPWDWQPQLMELAADLDLDLFSTPGDADAVDFLEEMDVPAYGVAAFDLVDPALVRRVAETGKPVILSTAMATLEEIEEAVRTAREAGCRQLALLAGNGAYPAAAEEMDLRTIPHLRETFGLPVGLCDHTPGSTVAVAAVALGAAIVVKHLTLSHARFGPDSALSAEPQELKQMIERIRTAEQALGRVRYGATAGEAAAHALRRSLFVVEDVAAGDELSGHNVRSIRPAGGLAPRHFGEVLGRRAARDLARGTPLRRSDVEDD